MWAYINQSPLRRRGARTPSLGNSCLAVTLQFILPVYGNALESHIGTS